MSKSKNESLFLITFAAAWPSRNYFTNYYKSHGYRRYLAGGCFFPIFEPRKSGVYRRLTRKFLER